MTDASARQDTPDNESGGPSSEGSNDPAQTEQSGRKENGQQDSGRQDRGQSEQGQNLPVPQWSAQQPAPAPWFLGQPGPMPPNFPPPPPTPFPPAQGAPGQYPPAPLPPPTPDQANWPNHAPGTRPEQIPGQSPQAGQPPQTGQPPQSGQAGPDGQSSQPSGQAPDSQAPNSPQQQPGNVPADGPARQPGQSPGPALGPYGSPQQPAPWLDPNRYNPQSGQRPPQYDPRSPYQPPQPPRQQQQQQRGEEPGKRPPLSLRTRWARGLSLGGAACTLITLLNGYRNFPDWLIGACAGLVMSLGGLWFGTFAQRDALRKSQRAPEAIASVVWSSISSLIALAIVSYSLIFFPQLRQYSDCMRSANTIAGQSVCQEQFKNSLAALP
ncbi:hypothetical protein [Actinocrinis sp.]|uniref:hypothetical protein n=1 Tax=Actinocrinis sp. TaxID=1920516 RepID=UPI002CDF27AE|nr:hypothetical protein [Actinocrinis sp.]HXR70187.1 hypothetical protein [Actinocrinis sp.]